MSRQLKNNIGERKLRVTLLSTEWKTSSNGDLTTINRELAIQMAKHPNAEVSVLLPKCSEEDKRDADSYNVKLIEAVKLSGFEPDLWLASVPDGHAMDCILGHGVALGRLIPLIKKNPNYSHCQWIQVVHTAPEEIGMYKNISQGQQMQQTEIELCEMADQVVTIGPKLTDAYKHQLKKKDVFNLTPSIFTEFSDVQQASDERKTFCVLVIESGDSEDFDVKGYSIAVKAIANLKDKSYQLKFASKQRGKEDELKHKLLQCGIDLNQLMICSFDENRETLANLFSVVDIAILPSKTEGFGLSTLEAISAGLPVLVSGNSGIAEALRKVPNGSQCIVDSEDPAEWARAIKTVRYKERNVRLAEAKFLRDNYLQRFSWKEPCGFLVNKMCNLAFGTSPLNVVPTTGHGKELEEPWGRKDALSSEFHSTSSTSESPQKKEQWEKSEQKTKVMETGKLEGTSPFTVVPTTGHGKELEEPWGRKGGEMNIKVDVDDMKPEEQNMQTGMLATESDRYQEVQLPRASVTLTASGSVSYSQKEHLEAFEKEIFLSIAGNYLQTTPPQSPEEHNRFKEYMKEMRFVITGVSVGSLVITVKCESLMILEDLWTDYSSGHLGEVVQNCFVTEKILKELNLAELRLKTTMDIEEYNACKMFFEKDAPRDALSSEFHSTSSTSESPLTKEQWEKSEQKTKIMETGKLEGTSPLTVVPTTGHGKELEEPWGRKAVPSSSFSTTNPGEEAVVSQPHLLRSTTGGWQKQGEIKRWEQNIETAQPEKFEGKMAPALAPSFRSSKETTNYARLCRLLVNVSAHILRETFDRRRPTGDLHTFLSSRPVHAVLQSLRKKRILSPLQWGKLYPAIKSAVSSKNFDITLLMVLLRNICGLVRPATGWDTLPPETDATLEADIVRIKCYRNTVYGHASQASVDDPLFNQYWQDIQDALVRLGGAGYQSAIDDLKKECMDPDFEEHYKELLKQWVVDEVSIKERLGETTEHFKESKESIADPTKKFKAGEKAVAEYSDALKESIKSQTEYLAQASPNMSNVRTDDIFTNILMQHGRKPVKDLDVKRKERLRQYGQISGKQIKSSQEIFIPSDGKHPESVLVTGKAGIGKTLFCQKLIKDWADNKLFRSRANAEVPDFKFTYLLTFRQLNLLGDDPVTLKDILNRSSVLDDHSNIDDSIFEYILHHSEEVLIIIDGYDECSQRQSIASDSDEKYPNNAKEKMPVAALCAKLIKGKILRGSVVMITSRPDESDEMKDREIYFDRYVEITGFSEPQVKEYIGKYFINNERMKNIVMDHITKNVNLVSFAHIPVLCFLMCSYFEYTLQQPKKNNPLPVKTSDLYDEVVNMFVQKHDRKKRASVEETLDELSKLAAQLLEERKFLFLKEDLKTLNLHEVESLCGSGLLHCGPPFRTSFSATTKHFCFTHLTLQEYLAARCFVKTRKIPPGEVSTEVVLFMSGILSKEKDNEFVERLIIEKILSVLSTSRTTKGLLISKCLLEYEDIEFAKEIVKKFRNVFCPFVGDFDLSVSERAIVDYITVSFALMVFGELNAEEKSEWSRITTLNLSHQNVANFASLCQALQTPTCKVTKLNLGFTQITDAGVASLCQALQTPTCKLTKLLLPANQITDVGVASLCQALQTPTCKLTELNLGGNQITDAGVASLCQALQTPTCKLTELRVDSNQITDAGVASLCQALQTPTCKVTELHLDYNEITDAGVASLCQALQTPTCKLTELNLDGNQITDAAENRLKYILRENRRFCLSYDEEDID